MSNEITLEALLQQQAGTTVQTFAADDRLQHTIENIRNGDSITEELLTDLKNRQDDIDTVITNNVTEIEDIADLTNIPVDTTTYDDTGVNDSSRNYILSLILKDGSSVRVGEGIGKIVSATTDDGTKPGFRVYVNNGVIKATHLRVYRNNTLSSTDYYFDGEVELIEYATATNITPNTEIDTNVSTSGDQPSVLELDIPSNYTTLDTTRIQAGQLVDGLDTLIQTNEIDFNDRTKLILEYTKK